MTEYRALSDDDIIMEGDEFFGVDGRWIPSKEVGKKVTTYNYKLYRRPATETSSQMTDNTPTNTDTCPDCSNEGVIWTQSFEAVRVAEQQERIKKDAKRSLMRRLVCWNYIINIAKKLFNS